MSFVDRQSRIWLENWNSSDVKVKEKASVHAPYQLAAFRSTRLHKCHLTIAARADSSRSTESLFHNKTQTRIESALRSEPGLLYSESIHHPSMAQKISSRYRVVALLSVLLCLASHLVPIADAIWLNVPSSGSKCVSEEIQNNVVVLADYYVVDEAAQPHHTPTISAKVCFPIFLLNFHFIFIFSLLIYWRWRWIYQCVISSFDPLDQIEPIHSRAEIVLICISVFWLSDIWMHRLSSNWFEILLQSMHD